MKTLILLSICLAIIVVESSTVYPGRVQYRNQDGNFAYSVQTGNYPHGASRYPASTYTGSYYPYGTNRGYYYPQQTGTYNYLYPGSTYRYPYQQGYNYPYQQRYNYPYGYNTGRYSYSYSY